MGGRCCRAVISRCSRPSAAKRGDGQVCEDLVLSFAQAHGVLDLEPDEDSGLLVEALAAERGRVVLSPGQD